MLLEDEEVSDSEKIKNKINSNDNILLFIFDFCDIEEILNLSLASRKFKKLTEKLDFKFEYEIEKNYFSNYDNYE